MEEKIIKITGSASEVEYAEKVVKKTTISGIGMCDRLVLQRAIDLDNVTASISYNGSTVPCYRRIVENLREMREANSLEGMSDETYRLLSTRFDFPRCNKRNYIKSYGNSYEQMIRGITIQHVNGMPDVNRLGEALASEKILFGLCG